MKHTSEVIPYLAEIPKLQLQNFVIKGAILSVEEVMGQLSIDTRNIFDMYLQYF